MHRQPVRKTPHLDSLHTCSIRFTKYHVSLHLLSDARRFR
jgi:hypothetical protein